MENDVFLRQAIEHNETVIEKVYLAKVEVEKLYGDVSSDELSKAINSLGLVMAEIITENAALQKRLLTVVAPDAEPASN